MVATMRAGEDKKGKYFHRLSIEECVAMRAGTADTGVLRRAALTVFHDVGGLTVDAIHRIGLHKIDITFGGVTESNLLPTISGTNLVMSIHRCGNWTVDNFLWCRANGTLTCTAVRAEE